MPLRLTAAAGPLSAGVLALPVRRADDAAVPGPGADQLGLGRLGLDLTALLAAASAKGEPGEVVSVPVGRDGVDLVLLAGVGDGSTSSLRRAAAAVARRAAKAPTLASALAWGEPPEAVRAVAEATRLAAYSFSRRSSPRDGGLEQVTLVVERPGAAVDAALQRAEVVADAVALARDLINAPALEATPAWFADHVGGLARTAGLQTKVWDDARLAAEGFGGIVAVGRGSARPPRLLQLTYSPRGAGTGGRHVVLVGKGITFDTGGLSLKPLDGMKTMKTDMAGAAAVAAAMTALPRLSAPTRVTALVPLAENMPGADANRPGDVIRHYGGRTVEVLNTDAEGRLVLADALAYAVAHLQPDALIDIATLTGAATLGLGKRHAAMFSTDDDLRDALVRAGEASGERLWPMPLVEDYRDALESPIADMRNIGDPDKGYNGGSITAALFLREFTGGVPWAHLDVAGPARADADEDEISKGGTGFGVRTFLGYLAP